MKIFKTASYKKTALQSLIPEGQASQKDEKSLKQIGGGRVLTFEEWIKTRPNIQPHLSEDGYAFYLEKKVLGRTPTIEEMRSIGKINRLLSDPI